MGSPPDHSSDDGAVSLHERAGAVFTRVRRSAEDERSAALDAACGTDEALRGAVLVLLEAELVRGVDVDRLLVRIQHASLDLLGDELDRFRHESDGRVSCGVTSTPGGWGMAGYSGTPLARKLGIVEGSTVVLVDAPDGYRKLLEPLPASVTFASKIDRAADLVQVFRVRKADLARDLAACRRKLDARAVVWVSWPKKAAKVPTEITEDVVREMALPLGFVDVKVCAVDATWSGLKLVVRKELR